MIKVALDYDNTYTLDPDGWRKLIRVMREFLHWDVRTVTMRSEELDPIVDKPAYMDMASGGIYTFLPIIYCDGKPKKEVCEQHDWVPDFWIDDKPKSIDHGSDLTPDMLEAWRANGRK